MADEDEPLGDLRDEIAGRTGEGTDPDEDGETDANDTATSTGEEPTDTGETAATEAQASGEPLGDLRADVESRSDEAAETDPFEQMAVGDVDVEEVWTELLMGAEDAPEGTMPPTATEGEYQIVNKGLCHRCRFFGDPPRLHCTHEGTVIHATVDMDHYRVSDCPMVNTDADPYRDED
ncbi:MAG: hypothetical protein ABEJ67_06780 [Halanaeroarchaeum sp.]